MNSKSENIIKYLLIVVSIISIVIFLFLSIPNIIISSKVNSYTDSIVKDFFLDKRVAGIFALFISIIYYQFVIKELVSLDFKRIEKATIISISIPILYSLIQYYITKDYAINGKCNVYNPITKKMEICNCDISEAKKLSTGEIIHPIYNTVILPMNRDIVEIKLPKEELCNLKLFTSEGEGIVWYEKDINDECKYKLYAQPGYSPYSGMKLIKIDNINAEKIRNCLCNTIIRKKENNIIDNDKQIRFVVKEDGGSIKIDDLFFTVKHVSEQDCDLNILLPDGQNLFFDNIEEGQSATFTYNSGYVILIEKTTFNSFDKNEVYCMLRRLK